MNRQEQKLLNSRTPEEYIDNSLKCGLPSGRKAFITRLWLEKKPKYTVRDIQRARNRHPYWKERKMEGGADRNVRRQVNHDYSSGTGDIDWTEKKILRFMDLNAKDRNGRYVHRDHEIARKFRTTIPAVQHYRRKYNLVVKILAKLGARPAGKLVLEFMQKSEKILREEILGAGGKR